ncbi:MAG TPA: SMP-30/gluconolactonase/LRE family protein, partial [Planctomycetota bacterium]|nr:SMP-30/gluconolactonase/LRE family protein [Planctomycetota bacterium]
MLRRLAPLLLVACATPPAWPGPQRDGSVMLPNGWSLQPYGLQVDLPSDLPVRMALHPGGRWLAIQHAGYRRHQVTLFDTEAARVTDSIPLSRTWSGMAWSRDGTRLHVGGGADDVVHEFAFDDDTGKATAAGTFALGDPARLDLIAGMCAGRNGALFVCTQRRPAAYLLDPNGQPLWTTPLPDDSHPFDCVLAGDDQTLFVSLWNRAEVWALASKDGSVRGKVATGPHPSELLLHAGSGRLFVTDGNDNTVTVIDCASLQVQETISSALFPDAPPGSTPNALALSPDGSTLLIANADNNDLAVVEVQKPGKARSRGFIPVGCYPTSVRFSRTGRTVYVANGKGSSGSHSNPDGPQPGKAQKTADDYTGSLFGGSLSVFDLPDDLYDLDDVVTSRPRVALLAELTATTYRCAPLAAGAAVRNLGQRPTDSPIPKHPGEPSPIRHVVYVIKENRTYDQMLGDLKQGNGEPKLCLFPRTVTPNHHALAEQFVLLDNFYVEAEVSADGHDWSTAAYATDFVERTWPVVYGGKDHASQTPRKGGNDEHVPASERQLGYPGEGSFPLGMPQNGHLWDLAARAHISYRSYGEFVQNGATPDTPGTARVKTLVDHFD